MSLAWLRPHNLVKAVWTYLWNKMGSAFSSPASQPITSSNNGGGNHGNSHLINDEGRRKPMPTPGTGFNSRGAVVANTAEEESEPDRPPIEPTHVEWVDLCIGSNAVDHHTDKYEMVQDGYFDDVTKEKCDAKLTIRRGQEFTVKVKLGRCFDTNAHLRVISTFGRVPLRSKGTHNEMVTGVRGEKDDWSVRQISADGEMVTLAIKSAPTCAIGQWNLLFDVVDVDSNGKIRKLTEEKYKASCYILFNAWCREDIVYMDNEEWRQEYVLNDSGKIYVGNFKQIFGKPWNFGQFESCVVEAALYLLYERSHIAVTSKGNPICISRKLSALVNSSDDYGVLTGRWDGNYSDGVSPTKWTGSVAILQKFMETGGRPVQYGQCWVFSGVMTSVCRALGIPTRSVTNFASAHDTDGSLTIDVHWNENSEPMPELDSDSVWNFHVWNECWMVRPDLKEEYSGWQVVDATPQETSDGVYCAGPASVAAVKEGDVGLLYDTPFVFAEVNADKVHWVKQKDGSIKKIFQKAVIGKKISTKAAGPSRDFSRGMYNPDREDITDEYKYPEGSQKERSAVWNAARHSTKPWIYKEVTSDEDVTFAVVDFDEIFLGQSFKIPIRVVNSSSQERTVSLTITLSSVYYTGITRSKLKQESCSVLVGGNSSETVTMHVKPSDYYNDMVGHGYAMKINYMAKVKETNQFYASQDDFRLRTIVPDIIPSKKRCRIGTKITVKVRFTNPLELVLTGCLFSFEAAGNLKPINMSVDDVQPGAMVEVECEVTAKRAGECVVICSFECQQMEDLQGQCTVIVD